MKPYSFPKSRLHPEIQHSEYSNMLGVSHTGIFLFQLWILFTASVFSMNDLKMDWITQPHYEYVGNAAYGVVGRTLYILGGKDSGNAMTGTTRTFDLDNLTFSTLSVTASENFELWSKSVVTVGSNIYFTGRQSQSFWKFDTTTLTYTELAEVPEGWGIGCLAVADETVNDGYIYQMGGTVAGAWWPSLTTIYVCELYN